MPNPYTAAFYQKDLDTVTRSAQAIVPMVMDLLAPASVVDMGCGVGAWLSVFAQQGVTDLLGVDGDYVERAMLRIPPDRFIPADLTQPLRLDRRFDLAVSLEVAEHLPADTASAFVESLTRLAPAVLFSAAAPYQGGTNHVNEQWPDYWADLFLQQDYVPLDCIRPGIWQNPQVESWYAQNMLLFVHRAMLERPAVQAAFERTDASRLSMVHPQMYLQRQRTHDALRQTARELARVVRPGEMFVMIDEEQLRSVIASGYRAIPFMQQDGVYWGPPEHDAAAISALEELREQGARYLVVAYPAFWWLDYYNAFAEHLRRYPILLRGEYLIAFDLVDQARSPGTGNSTC